MLFDFSCQDAPQRQTGQSISLLHQGHLVVTDVKRIADGDLATMFAEPRIKFIFTKNFEDSHLYCCTVHLIDSLIITQPTNNTTDH